MGSIAASFYNASIGKMMLSGSDLIIATTNRYVECSPCLRKYRNKIRIVPNGVSDRFFLPIVGADRLRERYGIGKDVHVILFVGAIEVYKGTDLLISSFKIVEANNHNVHLLIVGDGTMRKHLEDMVLRLGLTKKVTFTGYASDYDMPYFFSICDIFVLPSISELEGFGIVQIEAMAIGKPVIVTDLPGVNQVDPDHLASIKVEKRNPQAIADAILSLIENKANAIEMGHQGRKLALTNYSWTKVAARIERCYDEVLT